MLPHPRIARAITSERLPYLRKSLTAAAAALFLGFGGMVAGAAAEPGSLNVSPTEQAENLIGRDPCRYAAKPRPAVLIDQSRLEHIRADLADPANPRTRLYQASIKANATRYLDRPIVVPELGGWYHYFFCRTPDGTLLEIPKDQLFKDDAPARCPTCGATYLDDKIRGARRYFQHMWLGLAVRDLGLVYAIEGDKRAAAKAAEILERYADVFIPRFGSPKGGIIQHSVITAGAMIPFAEGYDLIHDTLSTAQRTRIEQDFLVPAAFRLSRCGMAGAGNWGGWHLSAIGVIGYATRHQRLIDLAQQQLLKQLRNELGNDGLWPESVGYHFFTAEGYLSLAVAAANHGDDLFAREAKPGKSILAMFTRVIPCAYPDQTQPAINDAGFGDMLPETLYVTANHLHPRPELGGIIDALRKRPQDLADLHKDQRYRIVLYDDPRPATAALPASGSTDFSNLGIAVLRQKGIADPAMMTFDYGRFLSHGQLDRMGVTLFAHGQVAAADYGITGYGVPLNGFLKGTFAHNTVMIDGKNQPRTKLQSPCVLAETPDFTVAAASTDEMAAGVRWQRCVLLTKSYAVISDRLDADAPHRYDWLFHAEGTRLNLEGTTAGDDGGATFASPFITEVTTRRAEGGRITARWVPGPHGGLTADILSEPGHILQAGSMATPLARQVPLLAHRQQGTSARYVAVLRLRQGMDSPASFQRVEGDRIIVTVPDPAGGADTIDLGAARLAIRTTAGAERIIDLSAAAPSPHP